MPEGQFIPNAVMTTKVRPAEWYTDVSTAKVLVEEWLKFRLAALRSTALPSQGSASQGSAG
jgi:hypothetical protein